MLYPDPISHTPPTLPPSNEVRPSPPPNLGVACRRYLNDPHVRRRMVEFLGADSLQRATCVYVSPPAPTLELPFDPHPPSDLWRLLQAHGEVARSLWDREYLIADLDIEHVHFDRPGEPLHHCRRSRRIQAPVVEAILGLLASYGILPLHFLTGRGHHFMWRIRRDSRCCFELARLGTLSDGLQARYSRPTAPFDEAVSLKLGAAYGGLGKLLEFFAHTILGSVQTSIPIELTAANVPPGDQGREAISLDLSLYGDPLDSRVVRLPFGLYLKGRSWGEPQALTAIPVIAGMEERALEAVGNLRVAANLAKTVPTTIPDGAAGTLRLLRHYLRSPLAEVHRDFYAVQTDPQGSWPLTYDQLDTAHLPPCVARVIEQPNDLILQPAAIQLMTRSLMALGWAPRHIAGLMGSKLERDLGWLPAVHFFESSCRADFYVRLFAGLAMTRPNDLRDFDCSSTRGRLLCPAASIAECPWRLSKLRRELRGEDVTGRGEGR